MSEFGSIKNSGSVPDSSNHLNNGSLAQFGVTPPNQNGQSNFESQAPSKQQPSTGTHPSGNAKQNTGEGAGPPAGHQPNVAN